MTLTSHECSSLSSYLLLGDCADKMRDLAPNSVDAIVTDPPYGISFMGMDFDNPKMMGQSPVMHGGLQRYAKGENRTGYADCDNAKFQAYMTPIFAEALRVAKPGAHLLAFGGTRTYHRLACAIEDAGWEVRDCIMWVYGSGFPKSMDVAKAIDKMRGNSQNFQRMYAEAVRKSGLTHADIDKRLGLKSSSCYWVRIDERKSFPTRESWEKLKTFLSFPANADDIYEEAYRRDRIISETGSNKVFSPTQTVVNPGTPATHEAAAWQGWGTCLKPAVEPIVVARKPLDGTVAHNVLTHGTGALNIDACRVPLSGDDPLQDGVKHDGNALDTHKMGWGFKNVDRATGLGRFPANLVHDGSPEVLALSGSAARFFYCAKASRSERGDFNDHVTVKPLALMRWLCTLVTPPGGIVLDPFMGSGTTGVAALQSGFRFIGIESDPHYFDIASRRIADARPITKTTQQELPLWK